MEVGMKTKKKKEFEYEVSKGNEKYSGQTKHIACTYGFDRDGPADEAKLLRWAKENGFAVRKQINKRSDSWITLYDPAQPEKLYRPPSDKYGFSRQVVYHDPEGRRYTAYLTIDGKFHKDSPLVHKWIIEEKMLNAMVDGLSGRTGSAEQERV
jgi:hypothetical protein